MHDMREYWRNQSYNALHDQQEQVVKTATGLASSRTAAQITSRLRDDENDAGANFSQQQRGWFSEIASEGGVETTENTFSKQKNTKQIEKLELG